MARTDLTRLISAACGSAICNIDEIGDGWPSVLTVKAGEEQLRIAAHVSRIGSHSRHYYEMRFQNPANRSPVIAKRGGRPLLIGVAQDGGVQPILVVLDGSSRLGREARFSILFNGRIIDEARNYGWSAYTSMTGERMVAVLPSLLPLAVVEIFSGLKFESSDIAIIASKSEFGEQPPSDGDAERLRRITSSLIRDYRFGRDVVSAYNGQCAMCGLDFGLVVGAHIYPASAPNSPDQVWNGLCLCQNHHVAFDRHIIWVDPTAKREIRFHPKIIKDGKKNPATKSFMELTHKTLSAARNAEDQPRKHMFEKRYEYYDKEYEWL